MKRREFIFRSLEASLLLSPILSIRRAEAAAVNPRLKVMFFVCCSGYPDANAFFPTGSGTDWNLSPILSALGGVKDQMTVIDNLNIRASGPNPSGAEHARSVAKVLTAKDVIELPSGEDEGVPGDISIDQMIARELGVRSINLGIDDRYRPDLRGHPFASGPGQKVRPIYETEEAWDNLFRDFAPPDSNPSKDEFEARMRRLRGKKSILDNILQDLKNFRRELVGVEKLKLDMHEDAIRSVENNIRRDLEETPPKPSAECRVPDRGNSGAYIPNRARAHFDLLYSALACERVHVGGYMFGTSGYHWNYEWIPGFGRIDSIHNIVHHDEGNEYDRYVQSSGWDWQQIGQFAERLKNTPDGTGTLLDNTLIVAMSLFGRHHRIDRIPVVLFGNAQGRLQTNRVLRAAPGTCHDQLLTSVARFMGVSVNGFGDDPNCGPLGLIGG